ncbi:uncharacterized protein SPPG_08259 [Spizellomyces punctatus DAOM BR117]|uniref:GRIP domain-containing protein n=1 Tax=Spizellomyces punctatus (strain DAOM BR117) TaxID=645134 RepID=A0A0L0H5V6_SPIPD|nr:uncharacterized protein SPPG_08259 [Spizellomyces punctatus DAOM BR117]KNC96359.1 hypothetical protein SPPG_08259 [Spizellomyces punctatus DAOM BR117]|eukprot:XP_016604399.1 hypothetical protein SPPG_08259 [Spizellomyces punctatus DAOM BR117]
MSWFDTNKLAGSIGSFASKVQSIAETALNDDHASQGHGVRGGEGWDVGGDFGDSRAEALERRNRDLEEELSRIQTDLAAQLLQKDHHIQGLEARIAQLRSSSTHSSPQPPPSPVPGQLSEAEQIQSYRAKLAKAVQHLKHLTGENAALNQRVGDTEKKKGEIEKEVAALKSEVEKLKSETASRAPVHENGTEAQTLRPELDAVKEYTRQLEEKYQESIAREEALVRRIDALGSEHAQADSTAKEAQNEIARLNSYVTELSSQLEKVRDEDAAKTGQLDTLTEELARLRLDNKLEQDANTAREAAEQETHKVRQQLSEIQTAHEQLEARFSAIAETNTQLENELISVSQYKDQHQSLSDLVQRLTDENGRLQAMMEESQARQDALARQLEQSKSDSTVANAWDLDVPGIDTDLQARIEGLEHNERELLQTLSEKGTELQDTRRRCEELEEECQVAKEGARKASQIAEESKMEVRKLQDQYERVMNELSSKDAEIQSLQHQLTALNDTSHHTNEQATTLQNLQTALAERDATLQDLQTNLAERDATLINLQAALDEKAASLDNAHQTITILGNQIQDLRSAAERTEAEFQEILEKEDQEHQSDLARIVGPYVKGRQEDAMRIAELEDLLARHRSDENRERELENKIAKLSQSFNALQRERDTLSVALEQAQRGLETLQAENNFGTAEEGILALCRAILHNEEIGSGAQDGVPDMVKQQLLEVGELVKELRKGAMEQGDSVSERVEQVRAELMAANEQIKAEYEKRISDLVNELEQASGSGQDLTDLRAKYDAAVEDVKRLGTEKTMLMDKLTTMKNAIAPKLQAELETSQKLRQEVQLLSQENEALQNQLAQLTATNDQLRSKASSSMTETARLHVDLESAGERIGRLERELDRLRSHLMETEDAQVQDALHQETVIKEYIRQIETLERDREQWEEAAAQERDAARAALERVNEMHETMETIKQDMERLRLEKEREAFAASNLQRVLEEFQISKEREIAGAVEDVYERLKSVQAELEGYKDRASKAEERLEKIGMDAPSLQRIQAELQEKNVVIGKLRHDVIQLQAHLSEAMRRMRDAAASEENVDRRLITNLLVSFLSAPRGDTKRFEILSVISSVLKFEEEEKVRVGLVRSRGAGEVERREAVGESFTDMWISFLLKESSKRRESVPISPVERQLSGDVGGERRESMGGG